MIKLEEEVLQSREHTRVTANRRMSARYLPEKCGKDGALECLEANSQNINCMLANLSTLRVACRFNNLFRRLHEKS